MTNPTRWLTLLLWSCLMLTSAVLPQPAMASAVQIQQGKTGNLPSVIGSLELPYPADMVWSVISNPQKLTQRAPNVKRVSRVSQSGSSQDLSYAVKSNPVLPEFNYVLRYQPKGPYTLAFNRVSGSFKTITGYWKVIPQSGGKTSTLVYSLAMDPGFAAPQALINHAIKMDVPRLMQHARSQVALYATTKAPTVANGRH
jgi:ribosome-associated toxin RatA of RatAB toxin-antitoxin module